MPDLAGLRSRVMKVLTSSTAMKIDFTLGSIHVDAAGFTSVYLAILNKTMGFPGIDVDVGKVPSGAAAAYDSGDDTFQFPHAAYGMAANEQAIIIHESVHAMRDLKGAMFLSERRGIVFTTRTEDEAAAYVAGALFILYDNTMVSSDTKPIFLKAYQIANSIMNRKGAVVPDTDVMSFRNIVAGDPLYHSRNVRLWTSSSADGLKQKPAWQPYGWR
jgi:hypothetical protein